MATSHLKFQCVSFCCRALLFGGTLMILVCLRWGWVRKGWGYSSDIFVTSCWLFVIILLLSLKESFITSKNFNSIGDYGVLMAYRSWVIPGTFFEYQKCNSILISFFFLWKFDKNTIKNALLADIISCLLVTLWMLTASWSAFCVCCINCLFVKNGALNCTFPSQFQFVWGLQAV